MMGSYPFELLVNPRFGIPGVTVLPSAGFRRAKTAITGWRGYTPTPLRTLPHIPGLAEVRLKDESGRFGLGSFKALGGAYAVATLLTAELARHGVASAVPRRTWRQGGMRRPPAPRLLPARPMATMAGRWHGAPRGSIAAV
jgi:diaminopropionate ammonia-lyase